jgi:hypothetical protein
MPQHEKLHDFMNYSTENYIVSEVKFQISMWAEMTSSSERTTNACESFHSKFNSFILSTSRYLYIFRNIKKKFKFTLKLQSKQPQKKTTKKKGTINNKIAFIEENINTF